MITSTIVVVCNESELRKLQIKSFRTRKEAIERINETRLRLSLQPERVHDPEDPNADRDGTVWIISVLLQEDADKLYVCTDGRIR
jgi:hypothetical protein